ncbi:hypothetical protein [Lewinella sp. LCG006]|uniref:hypothetical protein n=1 Tax=Lewinella sp. LCG006 TaxID=3231911 RepID=UPI0034615CC1
MKRLLYLFLAILLIAGTSSLQSCSRKSGCPAYETTKVKTKRNGNLSNRKGSSELFPKKMRRKG